jgi:membrane-associated phospholipid phosphatase
MRAFAVWAASLLICGVLVIILYFWIDRPVAYFVHDELGDYRAIFDLPARLPKITGPLVATSALIIGVRALMKRPVKGAQVAIVLSALSWAVSAVPENWLKFAFGRTWPETWIQDNPSLIRDQVYGFNPFHGGPGYAAFPSGHMVAIGAIVSIFWFLLPRSRAICVICMVMVFIGQLGANYHFLSDLIAGGFLGFSVGWSITVVWNAVPHPFKASTVPPSQ